MVGRSSAFAVLGLEPGADAAAVERAYKELIKQHHPDREGGDSGRAAEINRAYRELRGGKAPTDPLQFNDDRVAISSHRRWPAVLLLLSALIGGVALMPRGRLPSDLWAKSSQRMEHRAAAADEAHNPMSDRLHVDAIDTAVKQAVHIYRTKDEFALAAISRDCHRQFRDAPGTRMLDRCAAFDDAVVGLEDRDPLRDGGPFAPLAVTGRQWSAASALTDDSLAIDGRLDQIRLRVEMVLVPLVPPAAPVAEGD